MPGLAVFLPVGQIGPAEPEHHILYHPQWQVVAMDFDREHREIDVIKEIQIDMRDAEHERRILGRQPHANLPYILAPQHANRTVAIPVPRRAPRSLAIDESLDGREESDELVVVPFLKGGRIVGELVIDLM